MSTQSVDSAQMLAGLPRRRRAAAAAANADVVVKGRNVEIPDHFRIYVSEKLARLERFDRTIYLFDVELDHEQNRRQRKSCQHVEITARGRGPVVRGEACADSFYAAFESAVANSRAGCGAARTAARSTTATRRRSRWPRQPRSRRPSTPATPVRRTGGTPGRRARRPRARPGGAHQGAPRQADDRRRRPVRDGTGRPRLLPVPRQEATGRRWCTAGMPTTTG